MMGPCYFEHIGGLLLYKTEPFDKCFLLALPKKSDTVRLIIAPATNIAKKKEFHQNSIEIQSTIEHKILFDCCRQNSGADFDSKLNIISLNIRKYKVLAELKWIKSKQIIFQYYRCCNMFMFRLTEGNWQ